PAATPTYPLSLHDALPIYSRRGFWKVAGLTAAVPVAASSGLLFAGQAQAVETGTWYKLISRHSGLALDILDISTEPGAELIQWKDRKSTRLNSSHVKISYA